MAECHKAKLSMGLASFQPREQVTTQQQQGQ